MEVWIHIFSGGMNSYIPDEYELILVNSMVAGGHVNSMVVMEVSCTDALQ